MKKLLLLLTIVLTLFTVVYATEADLVTSPAPDAAETVTDETVEKVEVEDPHAGHDHGDLTDEVVPEDGATDVTTGDADTTVEEDSHEGHDHTIETSSNGGSTVVGAIIAIVVVVAVIAFVALLQKK